MDVAAQAGDFTRARALQKELEAIKELVFSEPIVEAVARIKIVLENDGLIKTATVRRPQLGISAAEKNQLLESYRTLKQNEFRATARAVG
jgi:dihydrodipicolinate synthase/N-acetylneuraminate lyase